MMEIEGNAEIPKKIENDKSGEPVSKEWKLGPVINVLSLRTSISQKFVMGFVSR